VLPKLIGATRRARRVLRELRPAVVVNVGGYASMPATFAARRLRIPVVVVSYDLRPGLASKVAARGAAAVAAAFPDSPLPRARLTGDCGPVGSPDTDGAGGSTAGSGARGRSCRTTAVCSAAGRKGPRAASRTTAGVGSRGV
jgi:hypothetical protein